MPRNALGAGSRRALLRGSLSRHTLQHTSRQHWKRLHPQIQLRPEVRPQRLHSMRETPAGPLQIDIDLSEPSPYQPRTAISQEALDELARPLKPAGIIKPIVVRPAESLSNERGANGVWRAAQRAGLNKGKSSRSYPVPDELALEGRWWKLQREDLNATKAARAFDACG